MNKIILVPTDFSEVCDNALEHGIEISKFFNYDLCILHVIDKNTKVYLKKNELDLNYIDKKLHDTASLISDLHKLTVKTISREGSIFSTIGKIAEEIKTNLIILGTHGKTGIQKLTGSYVLKVIASSPIPVIIVQKRKFNKGYNNIVFPVYASPAFSQKIQWAIYIAKQFKAKIHIFRIKESEKNIIKKLDKIIGETTRFFNTNNIDYEVSEASEEGNFAHQVINYSVSVRADLIMIMTNTDERLPAFILGPWDEKIIFNNSQIPVMCINPSDLFL
ncbi:MAG: universal stress protein [Bacteroidetes bacterium]|nr:universal stress protein [Bacteroidota bacterium]